MLAIHSFQLVINSPAEGSVDNYDIFCEACKLNITVDRQADETTTKRVVTNLSPFTEYPYEVKSVKELANGLKKESVGVAGVCKTTIGRK